MRNAGAISAVVLIMVVALACFSSPSLARPVVEESKMVVEDVQQCWVAVIGATWCIQDVFNSSFTGRTRLNPQCCAALEGISANCFSKIFHFLGPGFDALVKTLCAAQSRVAPSPIT
ncbi:hypothetical protein QJS04_geneDACA008773 [Acorus gramineus]|uniref:Prolamin-like domain-containing protein n=1 Tax=Acorus gramineus TaxID=55184 RepID=A0AAV9AE98_ACOGR|nr:hypothetical protein QJS04_geneDACA008773 [Acorus gramineus]